MAIKLVIADDAPFIREVIKQISETHGFKILGEAGDGSEVVQMVAELQPDIVIMDLVMPEKNGVEATEILMEKYPDLKVIVCTTVNNEGIVLRALKAGACDFITKPFTQEKFVATVRKAMGYVQENTL
tara:strand:+ start:13857 stop:14240 length:384 start_codon:yes stop_codon:yes gene_type:complete